MNTAPSTPNAPPNVPPAPAATYRSKTLAAWLALVAGTLGLHRFYLFGWRDAWGWLHPLVALVGLVGVQRWQALGQDDHVAWLLIPLLGAVISLAMGTAIYFALTPDERWDARYNPGQPARDTRWGPVLAAVFGLLIGGAVLMGTIAYAIQMFFEWQLHG